MLNCHISKSGPRKESAHNPCLMSVPWTHIWLAVLTNTFVSWNKYNQQQLGEIQWSPAAPDPWPPPPIGRFPPHWLIGRTSDTTSILQPALRHMVKAEYPVFQNTLSFDTSCRCSDAWHFRWALQNRSMKCWLISLVLSPITCVALREWDLWVTREWHKRVAQESGTREWHKRVQQSVTPQPESGTREWNLWVTLETDTCEWH